MNENSKAARDAGFAGVALTVAALVGERAGLSPVEVGALATGLAFVAARAYRLLRARWPWLGDFDPGANAATGQPAPPPPLAPSA